ncbi:hypothetical protein BGI30_08870 [Snodgrassella alvi]|jgi:hypothetical protein|uniref:hypothetical protein n=1 Tax=Snodgrassella alvi TaxID=1196083 RepID=UPI000C1E40AF|nr:hypothetical protein [Snodgrassella alvi]PIT08404.1 hypothetical protein BGI30_08870 [Snodgrassella alvi]PIT60392.1 hypothetical protein BHC59_00270 [Snodgrassella alvi]
MSNDVRGYINFLGDKNLTPLLISIEKKYNIGIKKIKADELYNFPSSILSSNNEAKFIFIIGDDNEYYNASFLIDYLDYAPEANIEFPIAAKDRLNILLDVMSDLIRIANASKMVISITECNQIEIIKRINFSEMRDVIHADFEEYQGPPDTLYEIIC